MYLIVGLGNPGKEYERTRHNLGFMLIDRLAHAAAIDVGKRECGALVGRGEIESVAVKLIKPQTYMNLSGEAVACLLRKHALPDPKDRLIVISDDLALPLGKIRLRERGSAGGHNGLKSIIEAIGTNEFVRLRIGIQPEHPVEETRRFVLSSFAKSEKAVVEDVLIRSVKAIGVLLKDGALKAMADFN